MKSIRSRRIFELAYDREYQRPLGMSIYPEDIDEARNDTQSNIPRQSDAIGLASVTPQAPTVAIRSFETPVQAEFQVEVHDMKNSFNNPPPKALEESVQAN